MDLTDVVMAKALAANDIESQKGQPGGIAKLDDAGKVLSSELPSYVDEVLEYESLDKFPATGESGKIYVAIDTGRTYRWSGTQYVQIGGADQIQVDWAQTDSSSIDFIKNKPTIPSIEGLATTEYVNTELAKKTTQELTNANGKSQIMNESDGGGIFFVKDDNTRKSFVGVNDSTEGGPDAQIYAIDPSNSNYGAKLDILKDGIYYTVGSTGYTDRIVDDNKLATLKDVSKKNAYNNINQVADYLFEVQYSTENIDYDYANEYFQGASADELNGMFGACSGVYKDGKVLRQFDYYYDNNTEFIVRRPADPEAENYVTQSKGIHGSIGAASGVNELTKSFVESGKYHKKFGLVPFDMSDGINDAGLYIQVNVVPEPDSAYNINPTATKKCAAPMVIRYILDHCATFDDVEYFFNNTNIYSTNAIKFGFHYLIVIGTTWKVVELTSDGHVTVSEGTGTNQMPHGIMTNFRTTGLTFTDDAITWESIEDYGLGVERYELAQQAFADTDAKTLEELRTELKYSRLYTDDPQTWKTELSGDTYGDHKLTVMDAKNTEYDEAFASLLATEKANYQAATRDDNKGVWKTTHSSIYDIEKKSFVMCIQERFDEEFEFALESTVVPESEVFVVNFTKDDDDYTASSTLAEIITAMSEGKHVIGYLNYTALTVSHDGTTVSFCGVIPGSSRSDGNATIIKLYPKTPSTTSSNTFSLVTVNTSDFAKAEVKLEFDYDSSTKDFVSPKTAKEIYELYQSGEKVVAHLSYVGEHNLSLTHVYAVSDIYIITFSGTEAGTSLGSGIPADIEAYPSTLSLVNITTEGTCTHFALRVAQTYSFGNWHYLTGQSENGSKNFRIYLNKCNGDTNFQLSYDNESQTLEDIPENTTITFNTTWTVTDYPSLVDELPDEVGKASILQMPETQYVLSDGTTVKFSKFTIIASPSKCKISGELITSTVVSQGASWVLPASVRMKYSEE